jgi:ribosome-associated protein
VPSPLVVSRTVAIPESELRWRFSRSSGPGGQSVNTTDSRVELSWDVATSVALGPVLRQRALDRLAERLVDGVLTVAAAEHRSQLRNREAALSRLAAVVRDAVAPPPRSRRATAPSRTAREERLRTKRRRADIKRARSRPDED